jgi:hypothetical protein
MSFGELLPAIRLLSRVEKLELIQKLAAELAGQENALLLSGSHFPVWSPLEAHEAAATLLQALNPSSTSDPRMVPSLPDASLSPFEST